MINAEQAKWFASQGEEMAIRGSAMKWDILRKIKVEGVGKTGQFNCALCILYDYDNLHETACGKCPLPYCTKTGSVFDKALGAKNTNNQADWSKYSNEMYELIVALLKPSKDKQAKDEKPELRHGDYGIDYGKGEHSTPFPMLAFKKDMCLHQPLRISHCDGSGDWEKDGGSNDDITWLGNIFDDLKLNQEDLEEFEASGQYDKETEKTLRGRVNWTFNDGKIWLHINSSSSYFALDQITEIIHGLSRMKATILRRQAKGGVK